MKTLESYVFRAEYIAREIWQIKWMEKLVFSTDFSMLMVQLLFQKLSIFCRKSDKNARRNSNFCCVDVGFLKLVQIACL